MLCNITCKYITTIVICNFAVFHEHTPHHVSTLLLTNSSTSDLACIRSTSLYMSLALHDKLICKDDPAHRALRAGLPMLVQNKNVVTIKKFPKQKSCTVYNLSIKHTCPTITCTLMTEPLQLNSKVNQFIYRSICNPNGLLCNLPKNAWRVYSLHST